MKRFVVALLVLPVLLGASAVAVYLYFFHDAGLEVLIWGLIGLGYFGFFAVAWVMALASGSPWLNLDAGGFEYCFPGRHARKRWSDVADFAPTPTQYGTFVAYADAASPKWWHFNRHLFGGKNWLPDTYGLGAGNLAALMNAWRERALGPISPHGSSSVSQYK